MRIPKLKRNVCNVIYWTLAVVAICIYFLTDLDFREAVKVPVLSMIVIFMFFDKRLEKCF